MNNRFTKKNKFISAIVVSLLLLGFLCGVLFKYKVLTYACIFFVILFILIQFVILKQKLTKAENADSYNDNNDMSAVTTNSTETTKDIQQVIKQNVSEVTSFITEFKDVSSNEAIYSVPWYLIIGPQGSGKSSLLLSSQLNFTRLASQRLLELSLLKQTSLSDWRLTEDALFLDTPGKIIEEDFNNNWEAYLAPIVQERCIRPLDGIIVVISCKEIINTDSLVRVEEIGKLLRSNINKIMALIKVPVPVYVIFSHIDIIPGYSEYNSTFELDALSQVFGTTVKHKNLESVNEAFGLFDAEFDYLVDSLVKLRYERLSHIPDNAEHRLVYSYPTEFNKLKDKCSTIIKQLFKPADNSKTPILRGFYFASTRADSPESALSKNEKYISKAGEFCVAIFHKVIRNDSKLARYYYSLLDDHRPNLTRRSCYFAILYTLILIIAGQTISFYLNAKKLDEVKTRISYVSKTSNDTLNYADSLLSILNPLINLTDSKIKSLHYRFGLFQVDNYIDRIAVKYFESIDKLLLSVVHRKVEERIKEQIIAINNRIKIPDESSSTDKYTDLYLTLKLYVMMSDLSKFDEDYQNAKLAQFAQAGNELKHIRFYNKQSSDRDSSHKEFVPVYILNSEILNSARQTLKNSSYIYEDFIFEELLDEIDRKSSGINLLDFIDAKNKKWFNSSVLNIPYKYTGDAYYKYIHDGKMNENLVSISNKANNIDWVLSSDLSKAKSEFSFDNYQEKYFKRSSNSWIESLKSLKVKNIDTVKDANELMDLYPKDIVEPIISMIKSDCSEKSIFDALLTKFFNTPHNSNRKSLFNDQLCKHISELDLESYKEILKEYKVFLDQYKNQSWKEVAQKVDKSNFSNLKVKLEDKLDSKTSMSEVVSFNEFLRLPINAVDQALGQGSSRNINDKWNILLRKARDYEKKYPINSQSTSGVIVHELVGYFKEVMKIADHDATSITDCTINSDVVNNLQLNNKFIEYREKSCLLLKSLNINDSDPLNISLNYTLRAKALNNKKIELFVDGVPVEARPDGPSKTLTWPAKPGQDEGLRIIIDGQQLTYNGLNGLNNKWGLFQFVKKYTARVNGEYIFKDINNNLIITIVTGEHDIFAFRFDRLIAPDQIVDR
jgi:hypothetical protein